MDTPGVRLTRTLRFMGWEDHVAPIGELVALHAVCFVKDGRAASGIANMRRILQMRKELGQLPFALVGLW